MGVTPLELCQRWGQVAQTIREGTAVPRSGIPTGQVGDGIIRIPLGDPLDPDRGRGLGVPCHEVSGGVA